MDRVREYKAKQNKSKKDKYSMISLICGIQETKQMSKVKKRERQTKEQALNHRIQIHGYQRGSRWGWGK